MTGSQATIRFALELFQQHAVSRFWPLPFPPSTHYPNLWPMSRRLVDGFAGGVTAYACFPSRVYKFVATWSRINRRSATINPAIYPKLDDTPPG